MTKNFITQLLVFVSLLFGLSIFSGQKISWLPKTQAQTGDDLKVSVEFWTQQKNKALEQRKAPTGLRPKGMVVPKELVADGVIKQKAKLGEMIAKGYEQPLDFADLAEKRLKGELVEIPLATETYFLDIGGSATEDEFTTFSFENGSMALTQDAPKYLTLKKLTDDFAGTQYDLNDPKHRKQIRIRLLRMVNPQTKKLIELMAADYQKKFQRPLRLTSMTRSMDYQIGLNATNSDTFLVREKGALPPHTSGCAFDLGRKHLTAIEQNFLMKKLAEFENQGKLDALTEFGPNACFHVFVYADGIPPKI